MQADKRTFGEQKVSKLEAFFLITIFEYFSDKSIKYFFFTLSLIQSLPALTC